MNEQAIPEDVRRFIQTTISSVPLLETILLLRTEPERRWTRLEVAQRLYSNERVVGELLSDLRASGIARSPGDDALIYQYGPATRELSEIIDRLADVYTTHLVEVTNLIHSSVDKKARQFAAAFDWRKGR